MTERRWETKDYDTLNKEQLKTVQHGNKEKYWEKNGV